MALDPQFSAFAQELVNKMVISLRRETGLGAGGTIRGEMPTSRESVKEKASSMRTEKALKDTSSSFREFNRIYKNQTKSLEDMKSVVQLNQSLFGEAINSMRSVDAIDKVLVPNFKKVMEESSNTLVQNMSQSINSLEDVLSAKLKLEKMQSFVELRKEFDAGKITLQQFKKSAKENSISRKDFNNWVRTPFGDLEENTIELSHSFATASRGIDQAGESMASKLMSLGGRFGPLAIAGGALAKDLYDAAKAASKFGTEMNLRSSIILGMSPVELTELQAQHKQSIMASTKSYDGFNSIIGQSIYQMALHTGGVKEAAELNAHLMTLQRQLGDTTSDTAEFLSGQQDRFKKWNTVFSMTAEMFQEMNTQLFQSQGVQTQLFKLNKNQRRQYFEETQQTYERLRVNGLMHTQALKMVETFAEIGAKSPKERMKEAAKLQATLGAMGMGNIGGEAAALLRSGMRTPEQEQRFAEIMKQAQFSVSEKMQGGFAQELMTTEMIARAGMEKYLGPESSFATLVTQEGQQLASNTESTKNLDMTMKGLQTNIGGLNETIGKTLIVSGDLLHATKDGPLFPAMASLTAAMWAAAGSSAFNASAGHLRGANKLSATGVGGVLAAGGIGYAVGAGIQKGFETVFPEGWTKVVGSFEAVGNLMESGIEFFTGKNETDIKIDKKVEELTKTFRERQKNNLEQANLLKTLVEQGMTREQALNQIAQNTDKTATGVNSTKTAVEDQTRHQINESEKQMSTQKEGWRLISRRAAKLSSVSRG